MAPRGIGSFFMMPITGVMTGRFDPRKLLAAGLVVGGCTLVWLSTLNLQAGYWDIFWPQLIQGVGHVTAVRAVDDRLDGSDSRASAWATRPACST